MIASAQKRAGLRRIKWHDLRHSCASSLVAGWWGEPWSLEQIKALLGHRSITTTERYAHLRPDLFPASDLGTIALELKPKVALKLLSPEGVQGAQNGAIGHSSATGLQEHSPKARNEKEKVGAAL